MARVSFVSGEERGVFTIDIFSITEWPVDKRRSGDGRKENEEYLFGLFVVICGLFTVGI